MSTNLSAWEAQSETQVRTCVHQCPMRVGVLTHAGTLAHTCHITGRHCVAIHNVPHLDYHSPNHDAWCMVHCRFYFLEHPPVRRRSFKTAKRFSRRYTRGRSRMAVSSSLLNSLEIQLRCPPFFSPIFVLLWYIYSCGNQVIRRDAAMAASPPCPHWR